MVWTAADANLKMSTHTASDFTKDNKVQPVQSSLCLNTPKMQSCFLEVISDQTVTLHWWRLCRRKNFNSYSFTCTLFWFEPLSLPWGGWRLRARNVRPDQWLHQGVSDCRSIPNVGHWPCSIMDSMANASQHQAMAHALTYGGSSTTNFHHLLQFQWQRKGPRQRVMDRSFAARTRQRQTDNLTAGLTRFKLELSLILLSPLLCSKLWANLAPDLWKLCESFRENVLQCIIRQ